LYQIFEYMQKIALITGATSGIGKATALLLAKNGFDVIITGRRKNLLTAFAGEIQRTTGQHALALAFDIRKLEDVQKNIDSLYNGWENIEVLINNAGLAAGLSPVQDGLPDDWERMIDTNIKGLLYISKAVIPLMIRKGSGHIINIGSIAGKEVYINGNVYCATKHAVDALTRGMRMELLQHNIKVTSISPGAVETEFSIVRFHGDEALARNVYKGFTPLDADDIADAILYTLTRPAHVNINDMLIMPAAQANATVFNRKTD
jgi:3-hydroxy acid dehydrogenase/malonic semialdehyde reductase